MTGSTAQRSARYGAAALLLALTLGMGQGTAWADTAAGAKDDSGTQSSSTTTSESKVETTKGTDADPKNASVKSETDSLTATSKPDKGASDGVSGQDGIAGSDGKDVAGSDGEDGIAGDDGKDLTASQPPDSAAAPTTPTTAKASTHAKVAETKKAKPAATVAHAVASSPSIDGTSALADTATIAPKSLVTATTASTAAAFKTAAVSTPDVTTTPITPGPLSPIAQIVALPGRIVNAILQVAGFTTAAGFGPNPLSPAPISDLVFAVFRRFEEAIGLDSPLSGQPIPPSLTYTGPLTGDTPTVAQFLNAATAEYVWGATPGGLVPLTVDGWPLTSTHVDTGETAQVWVTPQQQIIIAYSGTTGGSNLLVDPLIFVSQVFTDAQGAFSTTTPKAFTQAVDFAQQVQAEAVQQGYDPSDVFVTGHSLGAWEAQYVAQQLGMSGIGFEGPGLATTTSCSSTTSPSCNGANAMFVNTATYGDIAAYMSSDLPGLQPVAPPYVPGGGTKPHYGPIVLLGDPAHATPMTNGAALYGKGIIGTLLAAVDLFGNFMTNHLPGLQAYNLDVVPDPGIVTWLGTAGGPVNTGFGDLTLPELLKAASDAGILVAP
jgi:hypothetical protein